MSVDPRVLPTTLATWAHQLHLAGHTPADPAIADALRAVGAATDAVAGEEAAASLVTAAGAALGGADAPADVRAVLGAWYGDRLRDDLGSAVVREDRLHAVRAYQFRSSLPWLARIWERGASGPVPSWLVVERITDEVAAMDPNPWNDVAEDRRIALADFLVSWELDGCTSFRVDG